MTQTLNELRINARELKLKDLDFPECAALLKKHIDERISKSIALVVLDIRWCVIIYSQAYVFFDSCFSLLSSNIERTNKLIILTTDNYMTRELTCYELFRTTLAVKTNDQNCKTVTSAIEEYCLHNNLSIELQVFSGDTDDTDVPPICSYIFPEGKT